jgi:hypothetical protein
MVFSRNCATAGFRQIKAGDFKSLSGDERKCPAVGLVCRVLSIMQPKRVFYMAGTAIAPKNKRRLRF